MTARLSSCALALFLLLVPSAHLAAQSDEADRVKESAFVLNEIMKAADSAIPTSVLSKAEGIAIFPSTVRGGFIVGAERGRGILSVRDEKTRMWSTPAFLTITGGSVGLQIGVRATDLVLVIQNRRGLENLVRNQFKLGADLGVAAGPVGREAQAATDLQLRAQILSYSRARGLFAGVTVNGSTIRQDRDANERFYGKRLEAQQILFDPATVAPSAVTAWVDTLKRFAL